jgi:hypothetical protein
MQLGCIHLTSLQEPTNLTLAEFLLHNEGKRCVVVLDVSITTSVTPPALFIILSMQEIEKTEEEKALWSLLMPWELGNVEPESYEMRGLTSPQVVVALRLANVTLMSEMSFGLGHQTSVMAWSSNTILLGPILTRR